MAFSQESNRTPTSIGTIHVTLQDPDGVAGNRGARYVLEVEDQDGDVMRTLNGDLVPHLSSAQINAIQDFLDDIRAKAVNEVLP
jgi:hypothetical protein